MIYKGIMHSAKAVANYFLRKGRETPDVPPIDALKIQKLLFYANGWHLAHLDDVLFEEDIEAWPYGPVVRDIWVEFQDFGNDVITREAQSIDYFTNTISTPEVSDPKTIELLNSVWDNYKSFTGIQLSNSTHLAGEPWTIMYERLGKNLKNKPVMPSEFLKNCFKQKLGVINPQ
jgi:uncharacterized phage-associated protein